MACNLLRANLENANLEGANLLAANLEGADLDRANLDRANLKWTNLQAANLEGANLVGVRGLDKARGLDQVTSWRGARIERKWVEKLGFDAETLGLEVVDDVDNEPIPSNDE